MMMMSVHQVYRVIRRTDGLQCVLKQVSLQGLSERDQEDVLNEVCVCVCGQAVISGSLTRSHCCCRRA